MKVIKNINNNVSICADAKGQEVVVFGKGVGFTKPPYELSLAQIEQTFYNVDPFYMKMLESIDESVLEVAVTLVDLARRQLDYIYSSNIVFTLADHIQFAIKKTQEQMNVPLPNLYDLQYLYPLEFKLGKEALRLIQERIGIELPKEEVAGMALHLINAAGQLPQHSHSANQKKIIAEVTAIIETAYVFKIDQESMNYARFVSHLQYLIIRCESGEVVATENGQLYEALKKQYPKSYQCALQVSHYLTRELAHEFSEEELLYLMLHINRLCSREDCYQ